MINVIKKEIEESLKHRILIICDFCKTTTTITNGSIRKIAKTNLTYIEPYRIYINNNLFLAFNYSNEIYVQNLSKKIKNGNLIVVIFIIKKIIFNIWITQMIIYFLFQYNMVRFIFIFRIIIFHKVF